MNKRQAKKKLRKGVFKKYNNWQFEFEIWGKLKPADYRKLVIAINGE